MKGNNWWNIDCLKQRATLFTWGSKKSFHFSAYYFFLQPHLFPIFPLHFWNQSDVELVLWDWQIETCSWWAVGGIGDWKHWEMSRTDATEGITLKRNGGEGCWWESASGSIKKNKAKDIHISKVCVFVCMCACTVYVFLDSLSNSSWRTCTPPFSHPLFPLCFISTLPSVLPRCWHWQ